MSAYLSMHKQQAAKLVYDEQIELAGGCAEALEKALVEDGLGGAGHVPQRDPHMPQGHHHIATHQITLPVISRNYKHKNQSSNE